MQNHDLAVYKRALADSEDSARLLENLHADIRIFTRVYELSKQPGTLPEVQFLVAQLKQLIAEREAILRKYETVR